MDQQAKNKDKMFHDLAVAYAQAKLLKFQKDESGSEYSEKEIRLVLTAYYFAYSQFKVEDADLENYY